MRWTPAELEFLRQYADTMSAGQIGTKLGRSRNSIIGKAYKSRISLTKSKAQLRQFARAAVKKNPMRFRWAWAMRKVQHRHGIRS